jgi:hypothetical protein
LKAHTYSKYQQHINTTDPELHRWRMLHQFAYEFSSMSSPIPTTTIWLNSSMCIKPLTNTPFPYVDTTVPLPYSNSLKIHDPVLDE